MLLGKTPSPWCSVARFTSTLSCIPDPAWRASRTTAWTTHGEASAAMLQAHYENLMSPRTALGRLVL